MKKINQGPSASVAVCGNSTGDVSVMLKSNGCYNQFVMNYGSQVNLFDFVPEVANHQVTEEIAAEPFRLLNKEELEFTVINKTPQPSAEEQMLAEQDRRNKERIARLKELSMKLRTPSGIHDLETEPAYLRKKQALDAAPHSSESQVSRYTLGEENGEPQIKANNSFLHDNVD